MTTGLIRANLRAFAREHNPIRVAAAIDRDLFWFLFAAERLNMGPMQGANPPVLSSIRIEHLYVSAGHRFVGRHGKEPLDFPAEEVAEAECVAGRGIRGDRFFDHADNYKGQLTLFAMEVYEDMCRDLGIFDRPPSVLRRNVFVRDADLLSLVGCAFSLQGAVLEGSEECRPCYWMDGAFGPGAEAYLKGRGGLRARIVSGGVLRTSAR